MAMATRIPIRLATIISSIRVKPREWRGGNLPMQAFSPDWRPASNMSRCGYIVLLLAHWKEIGGQHRVIAEFFRDCIERLIEAIPLLPVAVEQRQLRCHCTQVSGV